MKSRSLIVGSALGFFLLVLAVPSLVLAQANGGARRRVIPTPPQSSGELLTVHGDVRCPEGFEPLFQGNIFAFRQKGTDPAQFGGVDPACWFNQPLETEFVGNWTNVGDCVVCQRVPPGQTPTTSPQRLPDVSGGGNQPAPAPLPHGTNTGSLTP